MARRRRLSQGRISQAHVFLTLFLQAADSYRVRILLACCAALLLINLALYLPADFGEGRIGIIGGLDDNWRLEAPRMPPAVGEGASMEAVLTDHHHGLRTDVRPKDSPDTDEDTADQPGPQDRPLKRVDSHRILTIAEEQPRFIGGIGRYYLNIDYPDEAREAGIQGRLVLRFTVGVDGLARDITVEESLHPLCDSSAVAALRRSHFVPGQIDGERVPMRLRLPVRFQLVDASANQLLTDSNRQ